MHQRRLVMAMSDDRPETTTPQMPDALVRLIASPLMVPVDGNPSDMTLLWSPVAGSWRALARELRAVNYKELDYFDGDSGRVVSASEQWSSVTCTPRISL